MEFARRVRPTHVVPIHDFYLSQSGREWIRGLIKNVLAGDDIELIEVDWGGEFTV